MMQLSRLGQGLAVSAVSALVITGLAMATPAAAADGAAGVRLLSQQDGIASLRRDADNWSGTTVTLAAEQLDPDTTIDFEYNPDPAATNASSGWVLAGSPGRQVGPYVSLDWAPDPAVVGTAISLRAVATTTTSPETTTYSLRNGVALNGPDSSVQAVSVGTFSQQNYAPTPGAFFAQPYADSGHTASLLAVSGLTSATDGTVELSAWNPVAGVFQGAVAAAVDPTELKVSAGGNGAPDEYVDGGRFRGVLDIAAYGVGDGDTLAVRARRDSDTVFPTALTSQVVGSIQVTSTEDPGPDGGLVHLTVEDVNMEAVVGAEVRRSSDGTLVGYTDVDGNVETLQPLATTQTYYVNTTDVDAFEDGVDQVTEQVSVGDYVPYATSTEVELADGPVFDDREYADGDIVLQVVDAYGLPFAGQEEVSYSLDPTGTDAPATVVEQTDAQGRLVIPFDPAGEDGEYTLTFSAPTSAGGGQEQSVTFTAGDADLVLSPLAGTGPSGGAITYSGRLTVAGRPLPGRTLDLAYARGTEQAPGTGADAGIGDQRAASGTATTATDGGFEVTVTDPLETGRPAESGGRLTVTARGLADELVATADFLAGPVAPVVTPPVVTPPVVDPGTGLPSPRLTLTGSSVGGRDVLRMSGPASAGRERARVLAKVGGRWKVVARVRLDRRGDATVSVRDRNAARATRYRVELLASDTVAGSTSKAIRVR